MLGHLTLGIGLCDLQQPFAGVHAYITPAVPSANQLAGYATIAAAEVKDVRFIWDLFQNAHYARLQPAAGGRKWRGEILIE
jgi:hypothetical protein